MGGELTLAGMTIRRGAFSDCILNSGTTVLQDSIVRDCLGDVFEAAVVNLGKTERLDRAQLIVGGSSADP